MPGQEELLEAEGRPLAGNSTGFHSQPHRDGGVEALHTRAHGSGGAAVGGKVGDGGGIAVSSKQPASTRSDLVAEGAIGATTVTLGATGPLEADMVRVIPEPFHNTASRSGDEGPRGEEARQCLHVVKGAGPQGQRNQRRQ
ncbi:MAG: hypothetical protein M1816_004718 [Peltula sp. TS41687]|nr:MAG: hypothetical protein M1816_004718 [Peltula sp. TS41687]